MPLFVQIPRDDPCLTWSFSFRFPSDLRLLVMGFKEFMKSRSGLRIDNKKTTSAATLTLRQSLWPLTLVTILFFLWVCGYDKHPGWIRLISSRDSPMGYWIP
jgi:hypothetical protein